MALSTFTLLRKCDHGPFLELFLFLFFKILFTYLTERERGRVHKQWEQQAEGKGEAGSLLSKEPGSLMQDSIPGPWDHDLS